MMCPSISTEESNIQAWYLAAQQHNLQPGHPVDIVKVWRRTKCDQMQNQTLMIGFADSWHFLPHSTPQEAFG